MAKILLPGPENRLRTPKKAPRTPPPPGPPRTAPPDLPGPPAGTPPVRQKKTPLLNFREGAQPPHFYKINKSLIRSTPLRGPPPPRAPRAPRTPQEAPPSQSQVPWMKVRYTQTPSL